MVNALKFICSDCLSLPLNVNDNCASSPSSSFFFLIFDDDDVCFMYVLVI